MFFLAHLLLGLLEEAHLIELSEKNCSEELIHHHIATDIKGEEEQNCNCFVYAWHPERILEDPIPSVIREEYEHRVDTHYERVEVEVRGTTLDLF